MMLTFNTFKTRAYLFFLGELKRGINMLNNELLITVRNKRLVTPFVYFLLSFGLIDVTYNDMKRHILVNKKLSTTFYLRMRRLGTGFPLIVELTPMQRKGFFVTLKHSELLLTKDSSHGVIVMSTIFGLLTHLECLFLGIGGVAICTLFF